MTSSTVIELVGYLGSFLVVVSMLMTSVKRIRIVNTVGSVIFTTYAFIIHTYPTAFMNISLIIINLVNLYKLIQAERTYSVIECYKNESLVQLYLKSNLADINKYFPDFKTETSDYTLTFLVMAGPSPVGIAIGKMNKDDSMSMELDYTIPSYRDLSAGQFLYKYLAEKWDVQEVHFDGRIDSNDTYLEKMHFERTEGGYRKVIGKKN